MQVYFLALDTTQNWRKNASKILGKDTHHPTRCLKLFFTYRLVTMNPILIDQRLKIATKHLKIPKFSQYVLLDLNVKITYSDYDLNNLIN